MTFVGTLWRIEVRAIAALFACACVMAILGFADGSRHGSILGPLDVAWLYFTYTLMLGVLPVVIYGAPLYALLLRRQKISWPIVLLISIPPAAMMFPFDKAFALISLICGLAVAALTHVWVSARPLTMRWSGP